jgi:hypothetical protein
VGVFFPGFFLDGGGVVVLVFRDELFLLFEELVEVGFGVASFEVGDADGSLCFHFLAEGLDVGLFLDENI